MYKRILLALLCAALLIRFPAGAPSAKGAEDVGKRLVMYVADWSFGSDITPEDAACITHINYSFGLIKDGQVNLSGLHNLSRLKRNMAAYPHIKLNLAIGGWGAGGFSEAVATEKGREKLADSAVEAVKALDLDGLDWDWEYPTSNTAGISASPSDNVNMTAFLVLMRARLDTLEQETGKRYEQSIAVGASKSRVRDYIWKDALSALDTVNIMTYDMAWGNQALHHANLYASQNGTFSAHQAVMTFALAGVPREKLMIGAAYYFYRYDGVTAGLGGKYEKRGETAGYGQYAARLGTEFERIWDDRAKAAVYYNGNILLSGDDPESLRFKGQYVVDEGLAGVIVWEYSNDKTHVLTMPLAEGLGIR